MTKMNMTSLLVAATLFGAALPASASNIVNNGDFQTGNLTGWSTFTYSAVGGTSPTIGTQWGEGTVVSFDTTGSGASNAAVFNVGQTAGACCSDAGGGIQQTFSVSTAGNYSFYMDIASVNDASGQLNGDPGTFNILVDGQTLAKKVVFGFDNAFEVIRSSVQGTVGLATGSHVLQIEITRNAYAANTSTPLEYVDNVSATLTGTPEPGSMMLLLGALGSMAVQRVRRRS